MSAIAHHICYGLLTIYITLLYSPPRSNALMGSETRTKDLFTLYRKNNCFRCDLSHVNFDDLDLISSMLRSSDLSYSSFHRTDLVMANLSYVSLQYSNLEQADLTQAVLVGANLSHARFIGATLEQADLREANMTFANFMNANLRDADIDMEEAIQSGAFFCGATLPDGSIGHSFCGEIPPDHLIQNIDRISD